MHYFKIKVAKEGIFRIPSTQLSIALSNNGFTASSIDSTKWAIFHRGKEISIEYNSGDILFYGNKANSDLDTGVYIYEGQSNPFIAMYTDTSAYFLTWYKDSRIGKRLGAVQNASLININYVIEKRVWEPSSYFNYSVGNNYSTSGGSFPLYLGSGQTGEYWVGGFATANNSINYLFDSINNRIVSNHLAHLEVYYSSKTANNNSGDIVLSNSNPQTWKVGLSASGINLLKYDALVPNAAFEGQNLNVNLNVSSGQFYEIGATLSYRATPGFGNANFKIVEIDPSNGNEISFEISDAGISSLNDILFWDITDPGSYRKCNVTYNSSTNKLTISVDSIVQVNRKILMIYTNAIYDVNDISFRNYLDLTNPDQDLIIVYPEEFDSVANVYSNYRLSNAGGNFNPLKIELEEVYDQFSFGEATPIGIRELSRYMHLNSIASSNYLFLMGKGLIPNLSFNVAGNAYRYRFNPEVFPVKSLVPTFGYPGGDWPYTMGFDSQNPGSPAFGVGRLSVTSAQQVLDYLEKIKEYEDPQNNGLWRKNLVHISGGATSTEILDFYAYVNGFKNIAEGQYLGGKVKTISKQNPNSLQTVIIDSAINEGISVLTMYGHSSTNITDIQIGDINDPNLNYNNKDGKYPLFIINGCESGRIYEAFSNWAQNWINEPGKGASLMLAHSHSGFSPILRYYTQEFYKSAFSDTIHYGQPIGDILANSSANFYNKYKTFWPKYVEAQIELMTLQGDPCLRLSGSFDKTDYSLRSDQASFLGFEGNRITSQTDSFLIAFPVENLGKTSSQNIDIIIERVSPTARQFDTLIISPINYSDTVYFTVYNEIDKSSNAGLNEFRITIDPANKIDESTKLNNTGTVQILIPNQDVRNVSPMNYGIVKDLSVSLRSTAYLKENQKEITYQFELDTTYLFDSPFKKQFSKKAGLYCEIVADILNPNVAGDSIVYYWRSKRLEDTVWSESSFTQITGSNEGWTQSVYGQYRNNDLVNGLTFNPSSKELDFNNFNLNINAIYGGISTPYNDTTSIKINGVLLYKKGSIQTNCALHTLMMVRIDASEGAPRRSLHWSEPSCGIFPLGIHQFNNTRLKNDGIAYSLMNILNDTRESDYILMMTHGAPQLDLITKSLKDTLQLYGIDTTFWDTYERGEPLIFFGKKYALNNFLIHGDSVDINSFNEDVIQFFSTGNMRSTLIGPGELWKSLKVSFDQNSEDSVNVNLFGLNNAGKLELLKKNLDQSEHDLSDIDPRQYQKLLIDAYFEDTLLKTSPQLIRWTVLFDGSPEGILDPLAFGDSTYSNLLYQEGDTVNLPFSFKNISDFDFLDSVLVNFSIGESLTSSIKIPAVKSQDSVIFDFIMATNGHVGKHILQVFVNPYELPELFYDNNILEIEFEVFKDNTPPSIFATFDGLRIANGDLLRYDTDIKITLGDDNPYFNIEDSSSVFFNLYAQNNFTDSLIEVDSNRISWKPETDSSDFEVLIDNDSLYDGFYKLEFNGRDASGNLAGPFPQVIEFEIKSAEESEFEGISIYPNPFSNSFYMAFYLNGSENPESIYIEIFDINSRKVFGKELKDEVKLGENRLKIWDGDSYSFRQNPSGMYFYKVLIKLENQPQKLLNGKVIYLH